MIKSIPSKCSMKNAKSGKPKMAFASQDDALAAIESFKARFGARYNPLFAYLCPDCNLFKLSSMSPAAMRRAGLKVLDIYK